MITDDFEKADILTIALIHGTNAHIFQRNDAFWHIFRGVLQYLIVSRYYVCICHGVCSDKISCISL